MASTVGTTTEYRSIRIPPQRNSFYAAGRYWVFYCKPDTNDLVYQTSTDGVNWGDVNEIAPLPAPVGANYDLFFDGTYVHYVRNTGLSGSRYTGIKYRRGTPQSDGTISWSAVEQVALVDGSIADDMGLCIDSNGYPWVAYSTTSATGNPTITTSSTNDGTWITKSGYPLLLFSGTYYCVFLLPQTNGKLAAIIYRNITKARIQARFYNGVDAWSAIEYITPDSIWGYSYWGYYAMLCGVAIGDEIHIVYNCVYGSTKKLQYVHGTSGSWSSLTTLASTGLDDNTTPVIAFDGSNLYVFWLGSDNHVYYRKYSGSWETAIDWIDETIDSIAYAYDIQCFYKSYGGYIGLCYQTKASSPYNVRFAFLSIGVGEAIQQAVNGALSFQGSLSKIIIRVVSKGGSLSLAGAISRFTSKNVQGNLSLVGVYGRCTFKHFAGTLTSSGTLAKMTSKIVSGALSLSGSLGKLTGKVLDGTLDFAGDALKSTSKVLGGALSPSGVLSPSRIIPQVVGGALSFAGSVGAEIITITQVAIGGVLSFAGSLTEFKTWIVDLAGELTLAGTLIKQTSKNLIGILNLAGSPAMGRLRLVAINGTLTFVGSVLKTTGKNMVGLLTSYGITNKYARKLMHGTVTFTGSVKKMTSKVLRGILTFIGILPHPGRDLTMRLLHRPYRDMSTEVKPYRDMSVESKDE